MIAPAGGSAGNQVTVLLKLQGDPANKNIGKDIASQVENLQRRLLAIEGRGHDDRKRNDDKADREKRRAADRALKEQERALREHDAIEKRILQDQRRQVERSENEKIRLYRQSSAELQRQQGINKSANQGIIEGSKMALSGVTALARGFVLLGAASEEDLEKALRTLAKFEAGAQALRGVVDIAHGGAKAWNAYRAAVESAATAQKALEAVRAAGNVAGAAGSGLGEKGLAGAGALGATGAVGGVGAAVTVGAAVAAIASSVLAFTTLREALDDTTVGFGSVSDTIIKAEGALLNWAASLGQSMFGSGPTGNAITGAMVGGFGKESMRIDAEAKRKEAAARAEREAESERRFQAQSAGELSEGEARLAGRAAARGMTGMDAALAAARGERGSLEGGLAESKAALASAPNSEANQDRVLSSLDRVIAAREKEKEIVNEIGRSRISALDNEIAKLQQTKDQQESILKAQKESLRSAEERFAFATPAEQERLKQAARGLKAGNLTPDQEKELAGNRDLLGEGQTAALNERIRRRAEAAGVGQISGERRKNVADQERIVAEISGKIDIATLIKIESEADHEARNKQITKEIEKLLDDRDLKLVAWVNQRIFNQAQQRRAGVGG